VQPARQYSLVFTAATPVRGGATKVVLQIRQPNGKPLIAYRHGSGPHTGVHVIYVRRDLAVIVHHHPPVSPNGTIHDTVVFPAPGPYRVVVDAYPQQQTPQPNFQLFTTLRAPGRYTPQQLPPSSTTQTVAGFRFRLVGEPRLRAVTPAFLTFRVTGPTGAPAQFTPWYGALARSSSAAARSTTSTRTCARPARRAARARSAGQR
jgi:hypothetical protein